MTQYFIFFLLFLCFHVIRSQVTPQLVLNKYCLTEYTSVVYRHSDSDDAKKLIVGCNSNNPYPLYVVSDPFSTLPMVKGLSTQAECVNPYFNDRGARVQTQEHASGKNFPTMLLACAGGGYGGIVQITLTESIPTSFNLASTINICGDTQEVIGIHDVMTPFTPSKRDLYFSVCSNERSYFFATSMLINTNTKDKAIAINPDPDSRAYFVATYDGGGYIWSVRPEDVHQPLSTTSGPSSGRICGNTGFLRSMVGVSFNRLIVNCVDFVVGVYYTRVTAFTLVPYPVFNKQNTGCTSFSQITHDKANDLVLVTCKSPGGVYASDVQGRVTTFIRPEDCLEATHITSSNNITFVVCDNGINLKVIGPRLNQPKFVVQGQFKLALNPDAATAIETATPEATQQLKMTIIAAIASSIPCVTQSQVRITSIGSDPNSNPNSLYTRHILEILSPIFVSFVITGIDNTQTAANIKTEINTQVQSTDSPLYQSLSSSSIQVDPTYEPTYTDTQCALGEVLAVSSTGSVSCSPIVVVETPPTLDPTTAPDATTTPPTTSSSISPTVNSTTNTTKSDESFFERMSHPETIAAVVGAYIFFTGFVCYCVYRKRQNSNLGIPLS